LLLSRDSTQDSLRQAKSELIEYEEQQVILGAAEEFEKADTLTIPISDLREQTDKYRAMLADVPIQIAQQEEEASVHQWKYHRACNPYLLKSNF
jgi:hypothetical protein